MGQRVAAVVYGVFLTADQAELLRDEDGEWRFDIYDPWRIETGTGDGRDVFGLAVAVQNVPEDGEADYPECRASDLAKELKIPLVGAKRKWKALVQRAGKHGVRLGEPELLLVEVERR